ncbi:hypothetical protein AGMMS50239_04350 [Bacteroidia bacterium]|nr:hypothetical protein AGMMS50239_04350 [Bacteroidia bacterium]
MLGIKYFLLLTLISLSPFLLAGNAAEKEENGNVNYIPKTPGIAQDIDAFNVETTTNSKRLAVLSLQGLANRNGATIYTYVNQDKWALELYQSLGYINNVTVYTSFEDLLEKYKDIPQGAVVYDPMKKFTVNIATNVAGVEGRIILSPDMVAGFKQITGNNDIKDLRDYNFPSQLEAFKWYKENIFPLQNHHILSVAKDLLLMYDVYRDYLVEFKIPVFWLPGASDNDYDSDYEKEIIKLFEETPPNIPVLGFWAGVENGKDIGYTEMEGVTLAGYYGKFTLVNTWVGNYSFHTGMPGRPEYKQVKPRGKTFREYDPNKKYVALIMNESGDAPCYFLYTGFFPRQWNDPDRGKVAINYGITPSLRMLTPGLLNYMYDTQTANDFFFTSISGSGYCYPFEGYLDKTVSKHQNKIDYFTMTANNMAILDFDMLGIYTHPASTWKPEDRLIAETYMVPMKGLHSIISGMHRVGYIGRDGNEIIDSVTVHHTLTHWSQYDYTWNDPSQDEKAVQFMENEIKSHGYGGNFIQAMFYSWHYGPRRLNKLRKLMEPQGYEFVTLNEFDYLCRKAEI